MGRRSLPQKDLLPYIVTQVLGAVFASWILLRVAGGAPSSPIDPASAGAFATNGFGAAFAGRLQHGGRVPVKW